MRISCVGGGPAGLFLAVLMKLRDPAHEVTVYERRPEGSTYGWGVTYWAGLLESLERGDPVCAGAIREQSVRWSDGTAFIHGGTTTHRGDEGFGIGRRELLGILTERARGLGVRVEFSHEVAPGAAELAGADLVVASDGVNSRLRSAWAEDFGPRLTRGRHMYAWLGTSKVFDSFTFAFEETEHGWVWCYGYKYSDERSTFVVECGPDTWRGLGLDRAGEAESLELLQRLFVKPLDGHALLARPPAPDAAGQQAGVPWQNFRTLSNRTWHRGNVVLLGDAAHTTHFSIGAGTTLALEDALALADALDRAPGLSEALRHYERSRRPAVLAAQSAARYSARWFGNLPRYTRLPPEQMFALLGQRHSPLLPYVPPALYYRVDSAVNRSEALLRFKRWLGPRLGRALHRDGDGDGDGDEGRRS
ncbi:MULTISPECIES: FAD-dependent monooxygenase [Streptomyces]|uniref:FAD-dependent monooxygenase n=1 Tax=Streptomyces TaxID=1883 RepID=UPI000525C5CC|nr:MULTISPECIES: FAD-dependent monooxygenase [Streptomyces]